MIDESDKLSLALLACQEERGLKRKGRGGFLSILAMVGLSTFLALFSYLLYDDHQSVGTLSAAREALVELLKQNEAVAVFLGIDETRSR